MGEVVRRCVAHDVLGNVLTRDGRHLGAELLGKAQVRRQPILVLFRHAGQARRVDMQRRPGGAQPIGKPARVADAGGPAGT